MLGNPLYVSTPAKMIVPVCECDNEERKIKMGESERERGKERQRKHKKPKICIVDTTKLTAWRTGCCFLIA